MRPKTIHAREPAICAHCNKTFLARCDQVKIGKGQFCSRLCVVHARAGRPSDRVDKSAGPDACWPWMGWVDPSDGYGRTSVHGKKTLAHRAVYEDLVGPILPGFDLLHSCDNPPCCNPRHLSPGMHVHNMADMARKGRARPPRGEAASGVKLTVEKVLVARRRLAAGETCASIAKVFGVSHYTILDIKRGKSWRHVP